MVCDECGINYVLLGGHSPGCSHYEADIPDNTSRSVETSSILVDAAADRGETLSSVLLKTALLEEGASDSTVEKYMAIQREGIHTGAWCGAYVMLQVLLEQDLIDLDSLRDYINSVSM